MTITNYTPETILASLMSAKPALTSEAPQDSRGIYGLIDHEGCLRYIGSTSSSQQTLYERIHRRHRSGSEDKSHYFARKYNTGRMYRDRSNPVCEADGKIAKRLRNAFIAEHCRAVWICLPDNFAIGALEAAIIARAPNEVVAWNRGRTARYIEPSALVDLTISRLKLTPAELNAIERQRTRYEEAGVPSKSTAVIGEFPPKPWDFVALDVETANNDRSSICQVGLAFVVGGKVSSVTSIYVDPETDDWRCTRVHGITAAQVRGAPTVADVLSSLDHALTGEPLFQHSGFDSSAVRAACLKADRPVPHWQWHDSVDIAKRAWPELKMKGGFGLQSLKTHLGLVFRHHDAGEDARAAAEVVLHARRKTPIDISSPAPMNSLVSTSTISSSSQTRPSASMPITREALKKLVINRLDKIAKVHPAGHQSTYSNRYVLTSSAGERIEIMFDKGGKSPANLWLLERFLPAATLANLSAKRSPGSDVYRKRNKAGELVYGRHSALRSMPQLERGDLVCIDLQVFGELHAILGHLQG